MEQDYTEFRPSRIWKRMGAVRRQQAAENFWTDEQSADQQIEAVGAISGAMKFRPKSVIALPLERKAKYLASLPAMPDTIAARALVAYHLEHQRSMMGAFLDSLGIAHENGLISDEEVQKLDADKVRTAAADLTEKFPPEDVALYFSTLVSQDPETWSELMSLPQTLLLTRSS
jgi:hypothetical protein